MLWRLTAKHHNALRLYHYERIFKLDLYLLRHKMRGATENLAL